MTFVRMFHWLALVGVLLVGCWGCEGDPDPGDDDDVADDDDDTVGDDDDDDTADDDDDSADDDDDDSADDDDDSADDDDDDDTADDDDDDTSIFSDVLEIHLDNQTYDPVGFKSFNVTGNAVSLADTAALVSAELPGTRADGCVGVSTHLDIHYCYRELAYDGLPGAAALADGQTGTVLFAAEYAPQAPVDLIYPDPLDDPSPLLATGPSTIAPNFYDYNLLGYEADSVGDAALDAIREMDYVRTWVGWGVYDAVVVLHPYIDSQYDAAEADLIVILIYG